MKLFENLGSVLFSYLDTFLVVDPRYRTSLRTRELEYLKKSASIILSLWIFLFVAHFFANDLTKEPLLIHAGYRFGVALLAVVSLLCVRNARRPISVYLTLFIFSAVLCTAQSWSMTLGYEIQLKWSLLLPALTLAVCARSLALNLVLWALIVFGNRPFWSLAANQRSIVSDSMFCIIFIIVGHYFFKNFIDKKTLELEKFFFAEAKEQEISDLVTEIEKFVSPVIVKRIRSKIHKGATLISAIDDLLSRKHTSYAVLYSDLRDFSLRSHEKNFIENQLIPSLRYYVDSSELNGGIARTIGDALFVYFDSEDPEESLLRSILSAYQFESKERTLNGAKFERNFIVTYGEGFVGNMISDKHRETTVMGKPANLGSRIDSALKNDQIRDELKKQAAVILSSGAWEILKTFSDDWTCEGIALSDKGVTLRTYEEERQIFLLKVNRKNGEILKELCHVNQISIGEEQQWLEN